MKAKGYSLWIMPKGGVLEIMQKTINTLAEKYSAPIFNPHITVLGDLEMPEREILKKTELIAKNSKPFKVKCKDIGIEDYYFRCLYLKVKLSSELILLNEEASRVFHIENSLPYMPHISLLYGDYPIDVKKKIISNLKDTLDFNFIVGSIHVFHAFGEPNEWIEVKEIPFKE